MTLALMPHGSCFLWNPYLTFLHSVSDLLIFVAYAAITIQLAYFLFRHPQIWLGSWTWISFPFIPLCGIGHLIAYWNIWHVNYWLEGEFKFVIAIASIMGAIALRESLPIANRLIREREQSNLKLSEAEEGLKNKVRDLERSNTELEEFAYVISHDLRAPLRTVRGFLEILFPQEFNLPDLGLTHEDKAELAKNIASEYQRLNELIELILQWSRAGRSNLQVQPINTADAASRAIDSLRSDIESSTALVEVARNTLPLVMCYPAQLEQVFQNLIGNALKFVPAGRSPAIYIYGGGEINDTSVVCVRDNGIGLDVDKFGAQIFGFGKRLHHSEYQGTGLGLAICKKIIEQGGGKIWVESKPGYGATFCFCLKTATRGL